MNTTNDQVVKLYEEFSMGPEEISEALGGLSEEGVRIILAARSRKFRGEAKAKGEFADVVEEAKSVMASLMHYTEQPGVMYKAAKFIINENKGRHDVKSKGGELRNLNVNVRVISEHIEKAKAAKEAARNKIIDVPSEGVKELIAA